MRPSEVLFQGKRKPVSLPACDHYAGSEKLMRKSLALQQELGPIFDITFDCEDGAAAGNEKAHAKLAAVLIAGNENRFNRIGARIHPLRSPFFEQDVALLCEGAAEKLAYLMVPKIESVSDAKQACNIVAACARKHGRKNLPIHVLIETHGALEDVKAIAALPEIESLSFGIMDFVSEHYGAIPAEAMHSPGQFEHPLVARAKLEIAAACHAHGKVPSHNVTTEVRDAGVVVADARKAAREFGFTRMWSIHPNQIRSIVAAFSPTDEDMDDAVHILREAQGIAWGPISHEGKLHDRASYRYYWTVLQRARASGLQLPPSAAALMETN